MTTCDLLVHGGIVVTLDEARRIYQTGAIAIENGRILAVGRATELSGTFNPAQTIDARGKVITPGLVNAHVHMSQHLFRGYVPDDVDVSEYVFQWAIPYYSFLSPEEEYLATLLACCDLLKKGTTLVAEAGTMRFVDECARAIRESGIRGVLGRWAWDREKEPPAFKMETSVALEKVESVVSRYHGGPEDRIQAFASVIGMGTCSDELLIGTKEIADRYGAVMNMHQSYSMGEIQYYREWIGFEGDPVEHFERLGLLDSRLRLVHMVHATEQAIDLLAARGVSVIHCDTAALKLGLGLVHTGNFPEMVARGVPVAIGTDTVNCSNTTDVLRAAYIAATIFKDARRSVKIMPAETVLEMCTLGGARSVGQADVVGSLEVGKQADMVIFDAQRPEWLPVFNVVNNLVYSADGGSVEMVIIGGEIVVENGRLTRVDEQALYHEVQVAAERVAARTGLPLQQRWPVIS